MTLEDLYRTVSFAWDRSNSYSSHLAADQTEVVIKVKVIGTAGPTPSIPVKHLSMGMDFNKGKIIIVPEVDLRIAGEDEIKDLKERYEELAFKKSDIDNLKKENENQKKQIIKLRDKINTLKSKIDATSKNTKES